MYKLRALRRSFEQFMVFEENTSLAYYNMKQTKKNKTRLAPSWETIEHVLTTGQAGEKMSLSGLGRSFFGIFFWEDEATLKACFRFSRLLCRWVWWGWSHSPWDF